MQDALNQVNTHCKKYKAKLIAVSKTKPVEDIQKMYELGQRDFGENRVQELVDKQAQLPSNIRWHQIGHLQTNKVKYIAPFVHLVHAADSMKILKELNKQAGKHDRTIACLLQIHIAREESKFGFSELDLLNLFESGSIQSLENLSIAGLMGMATFTDDQEQVRTEFEGLKSLFDRLKSSFFKGDPAFAEISMGMSGDYQIALEAGSTMVRVGSLLFGHR